MAYSPPPANDVDFAAHQVSSIPPANDVDFSILSYTAPNSPTALLCEGESAPQEVLTLTPAFSAVFSSNDAEDLSDTVYIQVATDQEFTNLVWDSGWMSCTTVQNGDRIDDIVYAGTDLAFHGRTFYWRIKFLNLYELESPWSETRPFTMHIDPPEGLTATPEVGGASANCVGYEWLTYRWYAKGPYDTDWVLIGESSGAGSFVYTGLLEGRLYDLAVTGKNAYTESGYSDPVSLYTDYELVITEVRDQDNNLLSGALVIALSEEDALNLVSATDHGEDLPALAFLRANKTDAAGQCKIRVPGNKGMATVFFVCSDQGIGGDIKVHVSTEEQPAS